MDVPYVGFLQFRTSYIVLSVLFSNHPTCLRHYGVFFRFLHFMSFQCFVTTTRAALTAHYSINPRLGLSLTHLPPSEDRRFRQTWVGLDIRKENAFMSRWDLFKWDLEPGSEILLSCLYRTSFFILRWEMWVCVSLETGLERFSKELGLSRSKEYKPWSLHLTELQIGLCSLNFSQIKEPCHPYVSIFSCG